MEGVLLGGSDFICANKQAGRSDNERGDRIYLFVMEQWLCFASFILRESKFCGTEVETGLKRKCPALKSPTGVQIKDLLGQMSKFDNSSSKCEATKNIFTIISTPLAPTSKRNSFLFNLFLVYSFIPYSFMLAKPTAAK